MSSETSFIDAHLEGIIALFGMIFGGITGMIALFWRRFLKVDLLEQRMDNMEKWFRSELTKSEKAHADINAEIKAVHKDLKATREELSYIRGILEKNRPPDPQ